MTKDRITTPFGATSTADDVIAGVDLSGKRAIVTGALNNAGIMATPLIEGVTGKYFEDCQEAEPSNPGVRRGVAPYALDPDKAARLWQLSLDLLAAPLPA